MRRLIILRDERSLSSRGSPAILQTPGGHIHGLRLAPSHPPEQLRMQEGQGQDSLRAPGGPTPHLRLGRAGLTPEWHHCPKRAPLCRAGQAPGWGGRHGVASLRVELRGSDWILGKNLPGKGGQALEPAVLGRGGVTVPRVFKCGTWKHGGLAVLGESWNGLGWKKP